jgi:hypothetical protein
MTVAMSGLKSHMKRMHKKFEKFEEFFEIVKSLDSDSANIVNEAFILYRSSTIRSRSVITN